MQKGGKNCGGPTKLKQLRINGKIIAIMGSSGDEIHPTCKRIISKIQNAQSGKKKKKSIRACLMHGIKSWSYR